MSIPGNGFWLDSARAAQGLPATAPGPDGRIEDVQVAIEDFPGEKEYWEDLARDLIVVRAGQVWSAGQIESSIDALKQSRLFRYISVDTVPGNSGTQDTVLVFRLIPFRLIKDIRIEGTFPLFDKDVLTAMTMVAGDTYTEKKLAHQEERIKDLFVKSGFPNPRVDMAAVEDPNDGHMIVHVANDKGNYERLGKITFHGNRAFSARRLKWKMTTWRVAMLPGVMGRFVEPDLKKDMDKLVAFYRKAGFADISIQYEVQREPGGGKETTVSVRVEEGRRYRIRFSGNERFWTRTLKKDLVLFREGNKNDLGIKKSVRKMKERYRWAGYLAAGITVSERETVSQAVDIRQIDLVITEGPCTRIQSIDISGNLALSRKDIEKQMLSRMEGGLEKGVFVPEVLEEDVYAIKALYSRHGYMDAGVVHQVDWSPDRSQVTISLKIEEGVQTTVAETRVHGMTVLSEKDVFGKIRLKEGQPFRKHMVKSDENALSAWISEHGYPHVHVAGEASFSDDRTRAFVTYTVNEGPFVKVGQMYYRGNFRTRRHIIDREFQMAEAEAFSLKKMLDGQRNTRNTDLFDSVKLRPIGLKEKKEEVDLVVEVEEKKPYFFEAGGGYESQKGLFLQTKAGDHNLMGTNKDLWLGGEVSEVGYNAELRMDEPRLFGSRISADGGGFLERIEEFNKDFGTDTYGASLGFRRTWPHHFSTGLSFRYEEREQFVRDDVVLPEEAETFEARSLFVTTPSIRYDTRDSFLRPKTGVLSRLTVDISKALKNDLDNFLKYRLDFSYYVTPLSRLTLAMTVSGGYLEPYGVTNTVPEDQLFFLGGTSDVRGFKENLLCFEPGGDPLGGREQLSGSVEGRIDLGANVELALFYDTGRIDNTSIQHESAGRFRSSVGIGLRYITPIGPLGILYGHKLDPLDGESSGQYHFAIGYTF